MKLRIILIVLISMAGMSFVLHDNTEQRKLNWINLIDPAQVDAVMAASQTKPALIFKHSTRCSISAKALASFEKEWKMTDEMCDLYFVDLLAFRPVSNKVSDVTGIQHQSPQALLIHKGKAVYSSSHQAISAREFRKIILKLNK